VREEPDALPYGENGSSNRTDLELSAAVNTLLGHDLPWGGLSLPWGIINLPWGIVDPDQGRFVPLKGRPTGPTG
jgi:hypothetical protein